MSPITKERAEELRQQVVVGFQTCVEYGIPFARDSRSANAALNELVAAASSSGKTVTIPDWCNPIRNDEEHKASLAVVERLIGMDEGTRTPEQDQELNIRATLIHEYESKRYPLYTAKDVRNASRWTTLEPFLVMDHDGDGDGSWYSLSIRDGKTGADSVEIFPREKPHTPASFVDCLIEGDSQPMPAPHGRASSVLIESPETNK